MEAKATAKMLRVSSQKANLVCELVRYKSVEEAIAILNNSTKKTATLLLKVINSAMANAVENHGMLAEHLVVKTVIATEGPTIKRYKPRAKGRADHKYKRTSHITVILTDDEKFRKGNK
jgi:large subunit ribosomal protein L22